MGLYQKILLTLLLIPLLLLGSTPYETQKVLNNQLDQALEQEQTLQNSLLEENLGDLWLKLNNPPKAILHYTRSLKLDPWSHQTYKKLQSTRKMIFIAPPKNEQQVLFADKYLTARYLLPAFAILFSLGFLLKSLHFWGKLRKKTSFRLFFTLSLIPLLISVVIQYAVPHSAVVLISTPLYRAPSTQIDLASEHPIPSGEQVVVLQVEKEGKWLKIETDQGTIGYVPFTSAEII